jgi:hypothetical protein
MEIFGEDGILHYAYQCPDRSVTAQNGLSKILAIRKRGTLSKKHIG